MVAETQETQTPTQTENAAAGASKDNPMMKPRLVKVVVNMGVGDGGERLNRAEGVMAEITGQKPVRTTARKAVREWGVRETQPIGCKVTLRGDKAHDFLKRALWVRQNRVAEWSFDAQGNCSFGIGDHTDFEGMRYNPDIGVFGLDVNVVLQKPGHRVKERRMLARHIPRRHMVSREEAKQFMTENFQVEVVE